MNHHALIKGYFAPQAHTQQGQDAPPIVRGLEAQLLMVGGAVKKGRCMASKLS